MKQIRPRIAFLAVGGAICVSIILLFLMGYLAVDKTAGFLLLVLVVPMAVLSLGLLIREYRCWQAAQLICENKIMHIKTAQLEAENSVEDPDICMEIIISCFGIILGTRIIKFNMDQIILKSVEISQNSISLSYGKDSWTKTIRIFGGMIEPQEMQHYLERFRYETGVIPEVKDRGKEGYNDLS